MLEEARKKGASIFIYLIFCLLIVIFVINFGPQGGGQGGGCTGGDNAVISVDGTETSQSSYHVAYSNPYNQGKSKQRTYVALETLIRRELLAQEAESRGMRATDDMVMDAIKRGRFFLGGQQAQIPGIFTEDGFWNQNAFRSWVGQLNVSKNTYVQEQQRDLLASMMSQILQQSVQVSRDEALAHYLFENNTVQYDVVAFRPEPYRAAMKLTDADVERFLQTHASEVEARFKADERTYKGVKPQLQLREIFIAAATEPETPAAPEGAAGSAADGAADGADNAAGSAAGNAAGSAAGNAAGSAAGSAVANAGSAADKAAGSAATPAPQDAATKTAATPNPKLEQAKAKLEAVRTAATKNKQKFIDAAKTLNTDEALKNSAGDLGWRTADNAMLGDKAVTDAVKSLKPGEMTPVITTDRGAYLILAEAQREGDLSYDQVKHELAKQLAKDVWSKEAAKRAALAALDKARAGTGLNLDQMYEKEKAPSNPGIDMQQLQKIMNDPNIPEEQKQQLLQMLMQSGQKQGSITIESDDVPASWNAQADGAGGGSAATAGATKPAAGATKPAARATAGATKPAAGATAGATKPAADATKPAAGATKPAAGATGSAAAGAGSAAVPAAGAGPATDAAAAAPAAEIKASDDKLPEFGEIEKPTVARFGPAPRTPTMSGIGSSKAAVTALFEELSPGMLAKQVYEGDGAFVVVQLISRSEPKVDEFDKQADRIVEELRAERGQLFVEEWMKDRCETLLKDGKIIPNAGLLRETDDNGNVVQSQYRPCMSFR